MIERANKTIVNMFSSFVFEHQRDWDDYVPFVMMAYRSSVHDSITTSPSMLTFRREIRLPIDLIFSQPERKEQDQRYGSQYANELRKQD